MPDDVIVNSDADSNLDSLIAQSSYQRADSDGNVIPFTPPAVAAPTTDESSRLANDELPSSAGQDAATLAPGAPVSDATPPWSPPVQPQNVIPLQQLQALQRMVIESQAQARETKARELRATYELETTKFEQSIQDLDPVEQQARRLERHNQMLVNHVKNLEAEKNQVRNELTSKAAAEEAQRENSARSTIAALTAMQYGVDPNDTMNLSYIVAGNNPQEMEARAHWIAQRAAPVPPITSTPEVNLAQQQPQANRAVDSAGLVNAQAAAVTRPAIGSGDLDSLISQTEYQVLPW